MSSTSSPPSSAPLTKENKLLGTASSGIDVRSTPGHGRGLFMIKASKRGDVVYSLKTRPIAAVLSTDKLKTHCSCCFLTLREVATAKRSWHTAGPLKRCANCKIVHYCSAECAKADFADHKSECKAFLALRMREKERNPDYKLGTLNWLPAEEFRAMGRLLRAKKRNKDAAKPCAPWEEYDLLESQTAPKALAKMMDEPHRLAQYVGIVDPDVLEGDGTALGLLLEAYGIPGEPDVEIAKLLSKYYTNALTLTSPDLSTLGAILSPALAMVNHSCDPNAVIVFPKGQGLAKMIAIKPIQAGEEILVSYTDIALPFSVRQTELSRRYNFICSCTLCRRDSDPAWVDPRWCLLHPGCKESGTARMPDNIRWEAVPIEMSNPAMMPPPQPDSGMPKCSACKQEFRIDEGRLYNLLSRGKSLLESDTQGLMHASSISRATPIRAVQKVSSEILEFCPPSSYPLIPLHRLLVRLMTIDPPADLQELTKPIQHLTLALDGARIVYGPHHPIMAVLLTQKGKLLGMDFEAPGGLVARVASQERVEYRRKQSALTALREALAALNETFSLGGGIEGISVEMEIEAVETDIGVMGMHLQMAGVRI